MKKYLLLTAMVLSVLVGCELASRQQTSTDASAAAVFGAGCVQVAFKPTLPMDVDVLNQSCTNAFAWQTFVAMTWPADPETPGKPDTTATLEDWGMPGNLTPMVFGTFKSSEETFMDHAPDPWGSNHEGIMNEAADDTDCNRKLFAFNKFNGGEDVVQEVLQAAGGKVPWLTDQNGNLIWYEEKINEVEFDYIYSNRLYDPAAQYAKAVADKGIWLPNGSMELKASWCEIPEDQYERMKYRYKIIQACVPDTAYIQAGKVVVTDFVEKKLGLVGLHIIHKTPSAPQMIWATFEHVDLAPVGTPCEADGRKWLLYNPADCEVKPNQHPDVDDPIFNPIQITKVNMATPDMDAQRINEYLQSQLAQEDPNNVFQYYRMVGSQWPSSAVADADNSMTPPLSDGGKTPFVLTNVSMESYAQGASCLTCHVFSQTAPFEDKPPLGADYSFLLGKAKPQQEL
ncbi:hypothetical protein [Pontibacter sp. G13]|uniref:hypothetical protein n=1 Tax=Pontibacter sp. G13 TaxID=3074898 RepID=UPI00288AE41B|nr:hypothetical protein [Pontibacter sp. G13]WNJ19700.1 hypothetical protein RJD25_04390 [Pontibacter sp. G13]